MADDNFNYTLVVQVPVPELSIKLDILGDFVLPLVAPAVIPPAVVWLVENAATLFESAVEAATTLIQALPEITITILVKVGLLTVFNVQLVAEKIPVDVPIPSFVLALPNLAVGLNIDLTPLIPVPPPVIIRVPVPVPRIQLPKVEVTGGNVSTSVSDNPKSAQPAQIVSPVRMPVI